jgi:hypothetical protein
MPRVQGKRIQIITREQFEAECCLSGWLKPVDVPAIKARVHRAE